MADEATLEKRVAKLEGELAEVKRQVAAARASGHWIGRVTGSFKDDPDFAEILRLGREIRQADRPRTSESSGRGQHE